MITQWVTQDGVAHTPISVTVGLVYAWCYKWQKNVTLLLVWNDDDSAPKTTCLWCTAETPR